jgi:4-hydroxyphenylpyruvate dioxygenase-like putative hemolysin
MPDAGTVESRNASSAGEGVRIAGLDHVVLRVGNLDRAIEFYERVLNCRVERQVG